MELVHIIFSIMTVAFITTFLLISFSYLTYKMKERKKFKSNLYPYNSNLNLQPILINQKHEANKKRFEVYNKFNSNYNGKFKIMNFTIYYN